MPQKEYSGTCWNFVSYFIYTIFLQFVHQYFVRISVNILFSIVNLNSSNSTVVEAEWIYDNMRTADFDNAWLTVKDAILDKFAGPADIGVYSPSVQHTLYQAEKTVLEKVPEVSSVKFFYLLFWLLGILLTIYSVILIRFFSNPRPFKYEVFKILLTQFPSCIKISCTIKTQK